jgi:hypothetical protein
MSALPPGVVFPALPTTLVQASLVARSFMPVADPGIAGPPMPFPIPAVWIEEQHHDVTVITEHPVENGAPITDHAFARPGEVVIRLGWNGEDIPAIQALYSQIVNLKSARTLFEIQTGKRLYKNMLIADISVMTDQRTENVLLATVRCREVIIVKQVVSVPASPASQAIPSSTAAPVSNGTNILTPAPNANRQGFAGIVSPL